jgi:hypothetical protein
MREIALRPMQRIDRAIASETVKRGRSSFFAWIGSVKQFGSGACSFAKRESDAK